MLASLALVALVALGEAGKLPEKHSPSFAILVNNTLFPDEVQSANSYLLIRDLYRGTEAQSACRQLGEFIAPSDESEDVALLLSMHNSRTTADETQDAWMQGNNSDYVVFSSGTTRTQNCGDFYPVVCTNTAPYESRAAQPSKNARLTIDTPQGAVMGYRDRLTARFQGIPYAQPPRGSVSFDFYAWTAAEVLKTPELGFNRSLENTPNADTAIVDFTTDYTYRCNGEIYAGYLESQNPDVWELTWEMNVAQFMNGSLCSAPDGRICHATEVPLFMGSAAYDDLSYDLLSSINYWKRARDSMDLCGNFARTGILKFNETVYLRRGNETHNVLHWNDNPENIPGGVNWGNCMKMQEMGLYDRLYWPWTGNQRIELGLNGPGKINILNLKSTVTTRGL